MSLRLDFCSHAAAKYACEKWHYTHRIPVFKLNHIGVWENGVFIGAVIFGLGASAQVHKQFGVEQTEICELVRVALDKHETPVSRIISIAIKLLRRHNPGLKVIVSFADPAQGHAGGIYQAGNWIFTGVSSETTEYWYNGAWRHVTDVFKRVPKSARANLKTRKRPGKYRYVMPLTPDIKAKVEMERKAYPKHKSADSI